MNAKIALRVDKKNAQGLCPVVVQAYHKRDVGRISLGFSLKPEEFNIDKEVVLKTNSNYKRYNEDIEKAKQKISSILNEVNALQQLAFDIPMVKAFKDLYQAKDANRTLVREEYEKNYSYEGETVTVETETVNRQPWIPIQIRVPAVKYSKAMKLLQMLLRDELEPVVEQKLQNSENENEESIMHFNNAWDKYHKYSIREKAPATANRLPNMLSVLKAYCERSHTPLMFESFTEDFGSEFKYYLLTEHYNYVTKQKGVSNGTVHNILKSISSFLNWAFRKGLNQNVEFKKWERKKPKSDLQYLTEPQLRKLFEHKLEPNSAYDKTRDLWLFSAFSGMRWGDIEKWLPSNVTSEGLIKYNSEKVKKYCTVGLNEVTRSILAKYDGKLPIQNDVTANKNIKKILAEIGFDKIIVNRVIGKGTKNIVNQIPLSECITLHSARRSFINLMISKGVSVAHLGTMVGNDLKSLSIYYKDDTSQMKRVMDEVDFFT
jgi:site-specific recombinase XerD